jgi:hypothetical protein
MLYPIGQRQERSQNPASTAHPFDHASIHPKGQGPGYPVTGPEWVPLFLEHFRRIAIRNGRCNARRAAELAGINRTTAYWYRRSPNGAAFRIAWDLISLEARQIHSRKN